VNRTAPYFNALAVEFFDAGAGKTGRRWTKIGVAFPHKEGGGFDVELKALPLNGRIVLLPPDDDTDGEQWPAAIGWTGATEQQRA
jgi:hypothetical protein